MHGVSFCQTESSEGSSTPVVAKRRKKVPVPHYVRCRFPSDHPIHAVPDSDTDSGSDCNLDEVIPSGSVSVHYKEIDGTPGLSLWTSKHNLGLLCQPELDLNQNGDLALIGYMLRIS